MLKFLTKIGSGALFLFTVFGAIGLIIKFFESLIYMAIGIGVLCVGVVICWLFGHGILKMFEVDLDKKEEQETEYGY